MKNVLFLGLVIILISCNNKKENENLKKIPEDVKYEIANDDFDDRSKVSSIDIQLNKKVEKSTLELIAEELKSDRTESDRFWIFYYLPNMKIGSGAWATTHFTPELEIDIIGSTNKQDEITSKTDEIDGEILGMWRSEKNLMGGTMTLFKDEVGILKMKLKFSDGSSGDEIITESVHNGKRRFEYDNDFGSYYLLEENGNLGLYDGEGKFDEAIKIDPN